MKNLLVCCVLLLFTTAGFTQWKPDEIIMPSIHGVKLFVQGNQFAYPVMNVGATNVLELHFDDLDGYVKNFNYTFQLCDADWQPADLNPLDYIKGFTNNRFTQYRVSSIAKTKYVHYQVMLPENNCVPVKSGNYLLKVFLNGDTSKLAFTKRMLVMENRIGAAVQIQQSFNSELGRTHQKVQFSIDVTKLNIMNPQQQLKVVVLQNYRWDNAVVNAQPTFMRQTLYEYNGERDFEFPAGKEFRWLDLQSFRFQSDRIRNVDINATPFSVTVAPDAERTQQRYLYYVDYNGFFEINTKDGVNEWWQGDYANVHFTYVPAGNQPYPQKDLYIIGQFTDYALNDSTKLIYSPTKGVYEKTLFLKQGYYTYTYATKDINTPGAMADVSLTDGNYWETENDYTVLVYYRSFSERSDALVGVTTVNSRTSRSGF